MTFNFHKEICPMSKFNTVGFVFLLGLMTLVSALTPECSAQQPPATAKTKQLWYGELKTGARNFRFVITTEPDSDKGNLQSLDEGARDFELTEVVVTKDAFRFTLLVTKAQYSGIPSEDGKRVEGQWSQSGAQFDLDLTQVAEPPKEELQAYWTGKLDAMLQKLDVAFRERKDGTVLFDSLTQKTGGFVASKKVDGTHIVFEVPAVRGTFTGEMNAEGTEIVGKWKQGLIPLNLTLTKSEPAAITYHASARPQTPRAPYPYEVQEITVENTKSAGVTLAGSLTLPNGTNPVPAVVLVSGSGPQDRDETIVDHKPFLVIADHLTRQGFAVLRCDDRGVGKSKGDFAAATTVDFASDTAALVAFLRQHPRIRPDKIVLCGHSEGGLVIPMVAAADPQIAGLILLAGPGVNGEQILVSQARLMMQVLGVAEEEITKQQAMQRLMIDLAKREPPLEQAAFVAEANKALKDLLADQKLTAEETSQMIEQSARQLTAPWFRFFLTYEPATALQKVRCPTLVLNGELDLQVDPKLNVKAIEAAFAESGFKAYETHVLPKLNHLFQTAKTGNVTEYGDIEETFSPTALQIMTAWLQRTLQ
jgi:pimeloyl-ACP methyl ester carboxylesterase